eukprot:m.19468 g.19468  ORF g.19468 m.19468 type:complete len:213 (+) comp5123_c0_seq1:86-724(+)
MTSRAVGRLLHTSGVVLRRDTEFVLKRKEWRKEISEFRKSVQHLQDTIGGRVDKRGRRRDRKKFRHLRATEQDNSSTLSSTQATASVEHDLIAKQRQEFYFSMQRVQRELKDFKIEQGMENYHKQQEKEKQAARDAVHKKMGERSNSIMFENDTDLEHLLRERVEEEVQYDFFIDSGRSQQSQRIANILGDFGSVFERSKVNDTTPKQQQPK